MHSELPVSVGAFVGREAELARLGDLVGATRVVTLTSAGGCGKTRLAVEVARDVASRFADGASWVDLTGVGEPAMVAAAVADAAGVGGGSRSTLVDTLVERLRARHLLLVLDNCEHLIAACAELVARLSAACPHLHVLATSREPLAVEGEAIIEVAPLPVPAEGAPSAGSVVEADAARLFEVRAQQVRAEFRIDDDNAAAVAEICRRLDGIPLAIELAAARLRTLAPAQIAAGLSDRFGLLTGGVRGAPPRQRTLEASLDWSYDLLDKPQQVALARLSVFASSFEVDAARAVVGGDGIDRGPTDGDDNDPNVSHGEGIDGADVVDLVAALVDRSLLQAEVGHNAARYRLLETVRFYARQRLTELDDPSRVRDRHLAFYVGLAARADAQLTGGQPGPWMARLAADLDDLRAAMDWAVERGDLRRLVDLAEPTVRFWLEKGLSAELDRRLHAAAALPGTATDDRVRAVTTAAMLAVGGGDPLGANRSANAVIDAARAAARDDTLAVGLSVRAWSAAVSGVASTDRIRADIDEAACHAERCGDAATHAFVLVVNGHALVRTRTIDDGAQVLQRAIEVCEAADVVFHLPGAHAALGLWSVLSGRLDDARQHAGRGLELSRRVGRPGWEAVALTGLAAADVLQGEHDRARRLLGEALDALRPRGLAGTTFDMAARQWFALAAYAAGNTSVAREAAEAATQVARDRGSRWDEAIGELMLGELALADGRCDEARFRLERTRALSTDPRYPLAFGRAALGLAELSKLDDELRAAWELAHDGLEALADYGDRVGSAIALEAVAELALGCGTAEQALRLLAASNRFHLESGIVRFPLAARRHDHVRDAARAALGDSDATACWDAGGRLVLEDAIAYARRGRGERQRPKFGWESVTPAELDLVRLVADGCTNAEIGERLFISVNTVKKHLSSVYAKLDVGGRADLAAEFIRREE